MLQILPYLDGINHVQRIAASAQASVVGVQHSIGCLVSLGLVTLVEVNFDGFANT